MTDDPRPKAEPRAADAADRRTPGSDRRAYWRGGRRAADWPTTLTGPPQCPRCGTPEVGLIEATPETLFWTCRRCRHDWESDRTGRATS